MTISIPTEGSEVSAHFGRCLEFTIVEINGNKAVKKQRISNPGHVPGAVPQFLNENGVGCIICSGIGRRAMELFLKYDIEVLQGVTGSVDDVIDAYLQGTLEEGDITCSPGAGKGYGLDKSVCDHQ